MALIEHEEAPPEACGFGNGRADVLVAIPARNEENRIEACLAALANQHAGGDFAVLVLANNCTDATGDIVRAFSARAPFDLHLFQACFDQCETPAARARRLSVNAAVALTGPGGIVLTTDADSRVDPNWVANNARALARADLICGAVSPDLWEMGLAFPDRVLQRGAMEYGFEQMAAEMEHLLDPLPWDPWPHHRMETGASLALTSAWLTRIGGVPEVEPGEDRALVNKVRAAGGRVRHAPDVQVITSCRLDGRARGGWADDLRERVEDPNVPCHDVLEPAFDLYRRAKLRAAMRAAWPDLDVPAWARALRLPRRAVAAGRARDTFGHAWAELEAASPRLRRRRLEVAALTEQTERMRRLLARVRAEARESISVTE